MWHTDHSLTKVLSDSPGLVDFPIGQADFSGHMPDGQAWLKFFMATIDWTLAGLVQNSYRQVKLEVQVAQRPSRILIFVEPCSQFLNLVEKRQQAAGRSKCHMVANKPQMCRDQSSWAGFVEGCTLVFLSYSTEGCSCIRVIIQKTISCLLLVWSECLPGPCHNNNWVKFILCFHLHSLALC